MAKEQGKMTAVLKDVCTIPNALTMVRIVGSPIVMNEIVKNNGVNPGLVVAVLGLAATDFLDGYLARKYKWQSKTGKILDPIADKVFNWGIAGALISQGVVNVKDFCIGAPLFLILARDVDVARIAIKNKFSGKYKDDTSDAMEIESSVENLSVGQKLINRLTSEDKFVVSFPAKAKMAFQSIGLGVMMLGASNPEFFNIPSTIGNIAPHCLWTAAGLALLDNELVYQKEVLGLNNDWIKDSAKAKWKDLKGKLFHREKNV